MAYEIRIAPAAERAIGKPAPPVQVAVLDKLEELAEDPRPAGCEKVKELAQYGVFRVKVADRKEVYQRLADLKRLLFA